MPATGKVSILRQTIYSVIPILDLYSAYHIKRLRWYLLVMIATSIVISIATSLLGPQTEDYDPDKIMNSQGDLDWSYMFWGEDPGRVIGTMIASNAVSLGVSVFVIRRWSKEWNLQFEKSL